MKIVTIAASFAAMLFSACGYAQIYEKLTYRHEQGFFANDLESFVEAADIIVVGKYGAFLRNFPFYGYNKSEEQLRQGPDINDQSPVARFAIPISEYQIIVDDVLKGGNLIPDDLVLRLAEPEEQSSVPNVVHYRDGNHLFFFSVNPDGRTVGLNGPMFDLKETNNAYFYEDNGRMVNAFGSDSAETFHGEIRRIVGDP